MFSFGFMLVLAMLVTCSSGQDISGPQDGCLPPNDAPKIKDPEKSYYIGEIINSDQFVCPADHVLIPRNGMMCLREGWTKTAKCIPNDERKSYVDPFTDVVCGLLPMEQMMSKKRGTSMHKLTSLLQEFDRIIGGSEALLGYYPWQVGVWYQNKDHFCGGIILSEYWILSATHCFKIKDENISKEVVMVRVGDHDLNKPDDDEQMFELEHLIKHSQYDNKTSDYDIALLKIKPKNGRGIKFGYHVQPACLPDQKTSYVDGQKCHVSGWGLTDPKNNKSSSVTLQSAEVRIINDETCRKLLWKFAITPRMVCAGNLTHGLDTCQGDSGGPLVCDINSRYTVMGVTSFGDVCGQADSPGVYARVKEYLSWIQATVQEYTEMSTHTSTDPYSNTESLDEYLY